MRKARRRRRLGAVRKCLERGRDHGQARRRGERQAIAERTQRDRHRRNAGQRARVLLQEDDRLLGPPRGEIARIAGELVPELERGEALDVREADVVGALALVPVQTAVGEQPLGGARVQRLGVHQHAVHVEDEGLDGKRAGGGRHIGRRPWMMRISTTAMAITSRM